jgi:hypothetical protein
MFANGIVMNDVGITHVNSSSFEWQHQFGNGVNDAVGLRLAGDCAGCEVSQTYFSGFDTPVSDEVGSQIAFRGLQVTGWRDVGFYLGGRQKRPAVIALEGEVSIGAEACIQFEQSSTWAKAISICHTAVKGDSLTSILERLKVGIIRDHFLVHAHVAPHISSSSLRLSWPAPARITVTASSTGDLTTNVTSGKPCCGASAMISDTSLQYSVGTRAFQLGELDGPTNAISILGLYQSNGTHSLPPGWLEIPNPTDRSVSELTLTGIQWSSIRAANLSECGRGARVKAPSHDDKGTVEEGNEAHGCTITFTTPWPTAPNCMAVSLNGLPLTSIKATTTTLVVTHAQGHGTPFSFACSL